MNFPPMLDMTFSIIDITFSLMLDTAFPAIYFIFQYASFISIEFFYAEHWLKVWIHQKHQNDNSGYSHQNDNSAYSTPDGWPLH